MSWQRAHGARLQRSGEIVGFHRVNQGKTRTNNKTFHLILRLLPQWLWRQRRPVRLVDEPVLGKTRRCVAFCGSRLVFGLCAGFYGERAPDRQVLGRIRRIHRIPILLIPFARSHHINPRRTIIYRLPFVRPNSVYTAGVLWDTTITPLGNALCTGGLPGFGRMEVPPRRRRSRGRTPVCPSVANQCPFSANPF